MFTKFNTHFHDNSIFACMAHGVVVSPSPHYIGPPRTKNHSLLRLGQWKDKYSWKYKYIEERACRPGHPSDSHCPRWGQLRVKIGQTAKTAQEMPMDNSKPTPVHMCRNHWKDTDVFLVFWFCQITRSNMGM